MSNALLGGLNRARVLRALLGCVALLIAVGLAAIPAQAAKFTQQGNKLVGTGAVGGSQQGGSVAVSADGNTAMVGGYSDDGNIGAVWVYVRDSNGLWTQQGNKLVGSGAVGNALQGASVALSGDGNTAIVGGSDDNSSAGATWVFTRSGGVWTQQGAKLVGTGAVGAANQGSSVAVSADGNTAIVGGFSDNSEAGATWVFTRSGGVWTQQGAKLAGTGAVGAANQGGRAALSADGNTAIVGGLGDNGFAGAAWVFRRNSNGVWRQQGNKLVGSGAVGAAWQGTSVALSGDGNTAMVGGFQDNGGAGAAWVFTRSGKVWTQQGNKLVGTGAVVPTFQGISVALSADANTAIVGGRGDNSFAGAAWMFTRSGGGVWTQQGNKLVGTGAAGAGQQRGNSVALSADGNTAIVGGDADNSNVGAVWVFGQPSIAGVTPDGGSVGGEDDVTISGVNLFNVTSVTFGGVAAINVTPVDAETVMATTPPHAAGRVDVILSTQTSGGSRLRGGYTYEPHATVTTLISSRNPSTVGQRVRFTASVSGGGNAASGKVTFKNGTQTLATRRLKNGVASIVTSELAAGTHTISVSFLRNRMFAGSRARLRQRVRN